MVHMGCRPSCGACAPHRPSLISNFPVSPDWCRFCTVASNMDPYLVTMMLVCTTLGYSLPFGMDSDQHSSCSESVSEALSRGSSAILEVRDARIACAVSHLVCLLSHASTASSATSSCPQESRHCILQWGCMTPCLPPSSNAIQHT